MTKFIYWITFLFYFLLKSIFTNNLAYSSNIQKNINNNYPLHISNHINMIAYDINGTISYRLTAHSVEYCSKQGISWFKKPILTTYSKQDKIPIWSIKSDMAKLAKNHIIYLYNSTEVNFLIANSQLRKITADNVQINLVTQDVESQSLVTLYGTKFNSKGLRMLGNLSSKKIKLIDQVKTSYDI